MTLFWAVAAALLVVALGLLLPPLLRARATAPAGGAGAAAPVAGNLAILRDQLAQLDAEQADGSLGAEQHRLARRELERRVLDEEAVAERPAAVPASGRATATAFAVVLLLPAAAAGLYAALGTPRAIGAAATSPAEAADNVSMQDVEAMVARLAARMDAQPDDPRGWALLGRTYAAMQRFAEASRAYGRALALSPDDAQLLADHADVLAMLQNGTVAGPPEQLVLRALKIAPDNLKALALAGSAAFERRDFATAIAHWTKARALAPAGSEFAAGLDRSIDDARGSVGGRPPGGAGAAAATAADGGVPVANAAGTGVGAGNAREGAAGGGNARDGAAGGGNARDGAGGAMAGADVAGNAPSGGGAPSAAAPSPAGTAVSGRVGLSPALAARALPGDTVFVFARAADGPRMPLAILRRSVADLPFSFTLDDAMAMSPAMKLSNFPNVVVGARVSKSGNAMPQPGDLVGQVGPVKTGSGGLTLVIDGVQP